MKLELRPLDITKCKEYLCSKMGGLTLGHFTKLIIESNLFDQGSFFTIAPLNTEEKFLYAFEYGGAVFPYDSSNEFYHQGMRIAPIVNSCKELMKQLFADFLTKNKYNSILIEDYDASPNDQWVIREKPSFYMAENTMVYIFNSKEDLENQYSTADGFLAIPILFHYKTNETLKVGEKLSKEVVNLIISDIQGIASYIYDYEGFLIWIKDDQNQLLSDLKMLVEKTI